MVKRDSLRIEAPSIHNWRTTDQDEVNRRRVRAQSEEFRIANMDARHPVFSNFRVGSGSGLTYSVEIRDVRQRQFACDCVDFRINGLGTCKHVEAVLLHLQARFRRLFKAAAEKGSARIDVLPDVARDTLRLNNGTQALPRPLRDWFGEDGRLKNGSPEAALAALEQLRAADCPQLRLSQEIAPWFEARRRAAERKALRHEYEL